MLMALDTTAADDQIVSDASALDFGTLGQLGFVPGWPGAEDFPPQPMVTQMRHVLDQYAGAGGRYEEAEFDATVETQRAAGVGFHVRDEAVLPAGPSKVVVLQTPGMVAMVRIALVAEEEGHHPDMEIGWGKVVVSLTTHSSGGLTPNDFIMAAKVDRLAAGTGLKEG